MSFQQLIILKEKSKFTYILIDGEKLIEEIHQDIINNLSL